MPNIEIRISSPTGTSIQSNGVTSDSAVIQAALSVVNKLRDDAATPGTNTEPTPQ